MSCVVDAFDTEHHIYIDRDAHRRAVARVSTAHKFLLKNGPGNLRVGDDMVLWRRWGAVIYVYFLGHLTFPPSVFSSCISHSCIFLFPAAISSSPPPSSRCSLMSPLRGSSNETRSPSPESPHE